MTGSGNSSGGPCAGQTSATGAAGLTGASLSGRFMTPEQIILLATVISLGIAEGKTSRDLKQVINLLSQVVNTLNTILVQRDIRLDPSAVTPSLF